MRDRITQMIPADGWYATFKLDDGSLLKVPLICWALITHKDRDREWDSIGGMESDDMGIVGDASDSSNFAGYERD